MLLKLKVYINLWNVNICPKELHKIGEPSSTSDYRNKSSLYECLCNTSVSIGNCHMYTCACASVYVSVCVYMYLWCVCLCVCVNIFQVCVLMWISFHQFVVTFLLNTTNIVNWILSYQKPNNLRWLRFQLTILWLSLCQIARRKCHQKQSK